MKVHVTYNRESNLKVTRIYQENTGIVQGKYWEYTKKVPGKYYESTMKELGLHWVDKN